MTNSIRLPFKIKHSVLTPAHKSQKRDKHKLFCRSFGQERFVLLFLITQTYKCGREWLCDYRGNSSVSWASRLPYCTVADSNCNPLGLVEQKWIGAATQRTRIQWKLGVTMVSGLTAFPHGHQYPCGRDMNCRNVHMMHWTWIHLNISVVCWNTKPTLYSGDWKKPNVDVFVF